MQVTIENYKDGIDPVLATFDIYLPTEKLKIASLQLRKSKKGKPYISWPSYPSGTKEDGSKAYEKVVQFSGEKQRELEQQLWNELKGWCREIV